MMGAIGPMRPEQFLKPFNIHRKDSQSSDRGRVRKGAESQQGTAYCILSIARPEEKERYQQIGVTVTHTVFHSGTPKATENDTLALVEGGKETRRFRVQAVHNKGQMGIFTTYYCEERGDQP